MMIVCLSRARDGERDLQESENAMAAGKIQIDLEVKRLHPMQWKAQ